MREVDNEDRFAYWLMNAKRGSRVMYFDGFLMLERQKHIMQNNGEPFPPKIKTALLAWRAYLEGLVVLVQRKKDEGEYEYIAIRR